MEYQYKIDDAEALKTFQNFEKERTEVFKVAVVQSMRLVGLSATSDFMQNTFNQDDGSFGPRADNSKLRIMTSRLARSLTGGFDFSGENVRGVREGIRRIRKGKKQVRGEFGSKVPYAATHEFGDERPVTNRQRAYFLYRHGETNADFSKWLAMAYPKSGKLKYPARPFLNPALETNREEIRDLFIRRVNELTRKLNSGN